MAKADQLADKVTEAFDAVKGLPADEQYKIEAFKLVLKSLLGGQSAVSPTPAPPVNLSGQGAVVTPEPQDASASWKTDISRKLGLTNDEVTRLFHLEGSNSLRLILDTKLMPKTQSAQTQDIAALVVAGRSAAKFDAGVTSLEIVREECDYYGSLNKKNFTASLKRLKPNFKVSVKDQLISITAPGYSQATTIAKKYLTGEK